MYISLLSFLDLSASFPASHIWIYLVKGLRDLINLGLVSCHQGGHNFFVNQLSSHSHGVEKPDQEAHFDEEVVGDAGQEDWGELVDEGHDPIDAPVC